MRWSPLKICCHLPHISIDRAKAFDVFQPLTFAWLLAVCLSLSQSLHFVLLFSQALEWYDLPEAIKYLYWDSISSEPGTSQLQVPYPKTTNNTTTTTTANSNLSPPKDLMHINNLALCEVQAALKDMEITNKVRKCLLKHCFRVKPIVVVFNSVKLTSVLVFSNYCHRLKPEDLSVVRLVRAPFSRPLQTLVSVTQWPQVA